MKRGKYANTLPKIQVSTIQYNFYGDAMLFSLSDRHGGRKPKETFVIELGYKSVTSSHEELINITYFFWYKFCSDSKILQDESPC